MTSELNGDFSGEYFCDKTCYTQPGNGIEDYKGPLCCPKISWALNHKCQKKDQRLQFTHPL